LLEHVITVDESYLAKLGWNIEVKVGEHPLQTLTLIHKGLLDGLEASIHGKILLKGPRGGLRWTPRFFVRRVIWHIFDHT
jgi:hypothetical protein